MDIVSKDKKIVAYSTIENEIFVFGYGKILGERKNPNLPDVSIEDAIAVINQVDLFLEQNFLMEHKDRMPETMTKRAKNLLERTSNSLCFELETGEVMWDDDCSWEYVDDFNKKFALDL